MDARISEKRADWYDEIDGQVTWSDMVKFDLMMQWVMRSHLNQIVIALI